MLTFYILDFTRLELNHNLINIWIINFSYINNERSWLSPSLTIGHSSLGVFVGPISRVTYQMGLDYIHL